MSRASEVEKALSQRSASEQDSSLDPIGAVQAFGGGMGSIVPGYEAGEAELLGRLPGNTVQGVAGQQAVNAKNHPYARALGLGTAGAIQGGLAALTGGASAAVEGLGAAGLAALKTAGQAAALTVPYKLGDIMSDAQLKGDPLRLEQIAHSLFSWKTAEDMVHAMGWTALLHAPGLGLEAVGAAQKASQPGVGRAAARQAGKLYTDTARDMGLPPGGELSLGQLALEKKTLESSGRIQSLKQQAGAAIGAAQEKLPVDIRFQEEIADELDQLALQANHDQSLRGDRKFLQQQSAALFGKELTGPELGQVITSLKSQASSQKNPNASRLYRDAAEIIQSKMEQRLTDLDPVVGSSYKTAVQDYWTYSQMETATEAGIKKQFTPKDAKIAASAAAAGTAATALGGPGVAAAVDIAATAAGVKAFGGKNYAVLFDKYSKAPPFATFLRQTSKTMDSLLDGRSATAGRTATQQSPEERYDILQDVLRKVAANPQDAAEQLRGRLDFLPPHEADAIVANKMDAIHDAVAQLPAQRGPATAFGIQTGASAREKRNFVERWDCKFDPYGAAQSGRPDLIKEAEKQCPETMHHLRQQLLNEIAKREADGKPIPYSTKRKLSAILGVAGVPMQDPALGAQLQKAIVEKRQAETQAGQIGSARQAAASMKNNKATLSRAQSILNSEGQ